METITMMRIFIVEDEERLARLISRVLKEEGYAAETARDGRTALSRVLADPFDLLIVDWMLPDLDGIEVIRRLRAAEDRKSTRLNSSHANISYAVFCLKKKKHTFCYHILYA